MDNYRISRDRAQAYFLDFDQAAIVHTWDLQHDEAWLYVDFLGRPYRICRKSGIVIRCWSGEQAEYNEVLTIFDLLCHKGEHKTLSGRYAPVNSLKGIPKAAGVGTDFYAAFAKRFDQEPHAFCNACNAMGGKTVAMGDIGFRFPLFQNLTVILKLYRSDEEFPASLTLLWDENTLQFLLYETVFYASEVLLTGIAERMDA